ncbi:MAG: endolytic transglycosylase MltG [Firmicutes bacterium]|nr:endolytic transglycosylase MltG [Bacillota bacterium]
MKKIKDLIYDYNDIFVALLIIAVAGAIIFWRVTNIMAYPDYIAGKTQSQTGEVDFSDVDLTPTNVDDFNENPEDITTEPSEEGQGEQTPADGSQTEGQPAEDPTQTAQTDAEGNYVVEIPKGSSALGIARILKAQGIISDIDAFMDKVEEMDAVMKLKYGTYKIPAGSSAEEIINKLM